MNSATYSKMISKEFGGVMKDELLEKLKKLILLAQKEMMPEPVLRTENRRVVTEEVTKYKPAKKEEFVSDEGYIKMNEYQAEPIDQYCRAMKLIRKLDDGKEHYVGEIPCELFHTFFAIAEMHPEIIFDEERDSAYFTINGFKQKKIA